jgi:hypothetical protein
MSSIKPFAQSMVGVSAMICILLTLSFSSRAPWTQVPKPRTAVHDQAIHPLQVGAHDRALGNVDQISASSEIPGSRNRFLEARGWAASCVPAAPLASVTLLVDAKPAGQTKIFIPRPDVAAAFGRPDFESSGWKISSSVRSLQAGDHSVILRANLENGQSIDLPGPKLTVH